MSPERPLPADRLHVGMNIGPRTEVNVLVSYARTLNADGFVLMVEPVRSWSEAHDRGAQYDCASTHFFSGGGPTWTSPTSVEA